MSAVTLEVALTIAQRLNTSDDSASLILAEIGLEYGEDYYGEDLGTEFCDVDDPDNNCIDLCWTNGTNLRVRRLTQNDAWQVEAMQRFNADGTPAK